MVLDIFARINIFRHFGVPAVEVEPTIYVNDIVYFLDDETGKYGWGIFEGFYTDLHEAGEASPYWCENAQGVHRVRIREIMADGTIRPNYILPENVYALSEVEGHVFEVGYGI